ncbi:GNAT family N-acetyltransferase [Lysobacter sp. TY2-98]|uniref:GNAT family N-acetyltransferase n=1 Tax=Lysobacter sp. TY2-98 TaxID=2290922 RepID=UPI0013B4208F|nr:GNAT family N-acetyltransferase [Lysobacter sp. TY2-98]
MSMPTRIERPSTLATVDLGNGHAATIRTLQATDAAAERRFIEGLSPQTRRERFLTTMNGVGEGLLQLLMAEDAEGPLAVVATLPGERGLEIIGVARIAPSGGRAAECAITVADAWQRRGLGHRLLEALRSLAAKRGIRRLYSIDAVSNEHMREFARAVGAHARTDPDDARQVIYELDVS